MFIDYVASWIHNKLLELNAELEIIDYAIGLHYSYIVVRGTCGKSAGLAITPVEDIIGQPMIRGKPSIETVIDMVSSINPLEKILGVALLNAVSNYLLWCIGYRGNVVILEDKDIVNDILPLIKESVLVIGNMVPLAKKLTSENINVIGVLERNPRLRCRGAFVDTAVYRLIPRAETIIVTGATLVNDTIDSIISLAKDKRIILVGPTAGIYPVPAIKKGMYAVASMYSVNIDKVVEIIRLGEGRWDYTLFCKQYLVLSQGSPAHNVLIYPYQLLSNKSMIHLFC